ncbi:MAG: methyltransferase domain-containing protein [Elusimicrobia bacterium]|nr:methyltransferase domain-containing protein [Elusimicrobiota bacterium]
MILDRVVLWLARRAAKRKMDRVFSRGQDPYGYEWKPYETERLRAMETAIEGRAYRRGLEIGCAEGVFTERIAARTERLTALDVSSVALERARRRLAGRPAVEFVEADVREWAGPAPAPQAVDLCDLIVVGDVLYYLDKPMVREGFEGTFGRIKGWLAPGGLLVLAHGFAGPEERRIREGYRRRFEALGLRLIKEEAVGDPAVSGGVQCLLSRLESPGLTAVPAVRGVGPG